MAIDLNSLSGGLHGSKIRSNNVSTSGKEEVSKRETATSASTAQTGVRTDSFQLSEEATALHERANSAPDINEDKVNAIRAAIADGSYKVDAKTLAKDIMQFETNF
ncbi:anti-sigma-28 factor, FlgM family [Oceanospirillum multiglobuliferum]|uniref:Negative regulator of flagellin synthesis n=1 Tax=Oceanospirillum multiglobuliferum TaxID=64969 RepID=A0A1T4QBI4_9GAMM|nr:flagellar biosynthesis anti-sigma factor FlgM [Oceanospirillum multiglobuliferum]OPX56531.1 flagellar biosynthesis anti-sigma factor FlgM [Oceanospirillum multiglobuliferum]SKA01089.1 anti-sigma-28 factor, FlgM family [Oceanospirillum multiglobuliferum]